VGLFGGRKTKQTRSGDGIRAKAYRAVVDSTSRGDFDNTLRIVTEEATKVFDCERAAVALLDNQVGEGEGSWALIVVSGANKGSRITESDCDLMPALRPGNVIVGSDSAAQDVQMRSVASSFRDDQIIGCQTFKGRIALHKDPTPDNDIGEGKLSALAIPMRYTYRGPVVQEKIKMGVLILYNVNLHRYTLDVERSFAALIAQSLAFSNQHVIDHQSGLRGEHDIELELLRQANLFGITKGKLKGGCVFGIIDNLTHYKKTIENETEYSTDTVNQFAADVIRGSCRCIKARCLQFPLDKSQIYAAGLAGRLGVSGFVCVLPLLSEDELVRFARALQEDVKAFDFPGENLLEEANITVSVRAVPFDQSDGKTQWNVVKEELSNMNRDQSQARGTQRLSQFTATVCVRREGVWLEYEQWRQARRSAAMARAERPAGGPQQRPRGPASSGQRRPGGPGRRPPRS